MSYAGSWPTLSELKKIVNVPDENGDFDVTLKRQLDDAIQLVKDEVGLWDDLMDLPDAGHAGAVLRAAYLLSLRETPPTILLDQVFATYMHGKHRRFAIA